MFVGVDGGVAEFDGVFVGVDGGVADGVLVFDGVFVGVDGGVAVFDGVFDGVDGGVADGVLVFDGVFVGVFVGVILGSVEQSTTLFTFPDESKVITYLVTPSINNVNPPGFDAYVFIVNSELLYIIKPVVIVLFLLIYFVNPLFKEHAA